MLYLAQVRGVNPEYERLGEFAVTLDDIKKFRQLDSRTPGHPEYRWTAGVETTTGPLGQGVGNSVGMAIAGKWLAARFNQPGFEIFDYNVYAMCGDGDMMEGVGQRSRIPGRPSEAFQPLLDLRREPRHAGWPGRRVLHRRRGQTI